jgi:NADH dehydrogenase
MPSIIVAGGGYAGLQTVLRLRRKLPRNWSITLLDRSPCHQLITRLPEIAAEALAPDRACIPFERILPSDVQFVRCTVTDIDPTHHMVTTDRGAFTGEWLVVALGSESGSLGIPGAAEYGLSVKTIPAAIHLHDLMVDRLGRLPRVHVALVGAGYTGTEVAGELAEWNTRLGGGRIKVTLVALDTQLLPEGNRMLGHIAQRVLAEKGVLLRLGTAVREVRPDRLVTSAGEITADIVVWAAKSVSRIPSSWDGWARGKDNRIGVDAYLRAVGHERIYVAGDSAFAYDYSRDQVAASSAQLAVQEGEVVARNLLAELFGQELEEFRPRILGEALTLGGRDGVADVGGLVVTGRRALAAKEAALLRYLVGLGGPRLAAQYR